MRHVCRSEARERRLLQRGGLPHGAAGVASYLRMVGPRIGTGVIGDHGVTLIGPVGVREREYAADGLAEPVGRGHLPPP